MSQVLVADTEAQDSSHASNDMKVFIISLLLA
jgi:hypothetical protein